MRIIAGTARGRKIDAPEGIHTRPTLDRVRENLFNILQNRTRDSRVLDLFAGSGALSMEALSRGAAHAVLVDSDRNASRIQRKNLEQLGMADRAEVFLCDWRKAAAEDTASKYFFAAVPYGPFETSPDTYAMPSKKHPFGTDNVGRDVFARMTYGARVSLSVGFLATAIELVLGTMIGLFSGYRGGRVDLAVQRLVEIVICFPTFLLLLILMSIMLDYGTRQSILLVIFVLGMTGWPGLSRLVRGEVLKARQMAYIQSCESLGVPLHSILFRHLLPNVSGPIFVSFAFSIAGFILAENSLSFLGFGVQAPSASWGELLKQAFADPLSYWNLMLWPGLAIFLCVTAFNFIADGIRRSIDLKS